MKRNQVLATVITATATGALGGFVVADAKNQINILPQNTIDIINEKILNQYRKEYRYDLFNDFIPNMNQYVVDLHTVDLCVM